MTKQLKEIEISFGANDSELCGWEYTIPEGMEATIVDNKIIVKKKESEDERIRKALLNEFIHLQSKGYKFAGLEGGEIVAWIEKQAKKGTEPFKAEHGKYYYCIKDYFCGGKKQASKGDVVQALRGLPIMGLKDASEYFLPVNSIKCNSNWSEKDEDMLQSILDEYKSMTIEKRNWLKSLKERVQLQPKQEWSEEEFAHIVGYLVQDVVANEHMPEEEKQPTKFFIEKYYNKLRIQSQWKPSNEQMEVLFKYAEQNNYDGSVLTSLYQDLKKLK